MEILDKKISELMAEYNEIFEAREDHGYLDYNELFCEWVYERLTGDSCTCAYATNDEVWALSSTNEMIQVLVLECQGIHEDEIYYGCIDEDGIHISYAERELFKTKEALISSQLEKWRLLKEDHKCSSYDVVHTFDGSTRFICKCGEI